MRLLKDDELVQYVTGVHPIVVGIQQPNDWYASDSPIQPASIDLRIGKIYVPETEDGEPGSPTNPYEGATEQFIPKVGRTAIVATHEKVVLPADIAAFGFPPSAISSRGILMTNPGHIDPGYEGYLHFTVINMGCEDFALVVGDQIVTLLFAQLSGPARAAYAARTKGATPRPTTARQLSRLASDFLDIERRATKIADGAVRRVNWTVGIAGALIAAVAAISGYIITGWQAVPLKDVQTQMDVLKKQVEFADTRNKLDSMEMRVKALEATTATPKNPVAPPPSPTP